MIRGGGYRQPLADIKAKIYGVCAAGQVAASAAEASRGYFGHNFPLATLEEFASLHRDALTDPERELIGACVGLGWAWY